MHAPIAPILAGVSLELDTCVVKLRNGDDSLRLIEVFHDNNPEYSSDSRVWECGLVLGRCIRQSRLPNSCESLLRDDLLQRDKSETCDISCAEEPLPATAVIDLGSGTGIVGLSAARLGLADHIFLTEMNAVLPLLAQNAQLNAEGRFQVFGPGSEAELVSNLENARPASSTCVHVHALDWREPRNDNGCMFSVTRALCAFNERASIRENPDASTSCEPDQQSQRIFERVTVFASDCVYSPREIDNLVEVLRSIIADLEQIPRVRAFEVIMAVKLRLHSETNRTACAKFLGKLGEWIFGETASGWQEWRSAERMLEQVQAGNANDDLASRCGLCEGPTICNLVLEDVKWKHRADLLKDLKNKKIGDIAIFRISGGHSLRRDLHGSMDSLASTVHTDFTSDDSA